MGTGTESHANTEGQESVIYALLAVFFVYLVIYMYEKTKRISRIEDLPDNYKGMRLYGVVTENPDGDGFWFFHCPWLRERSYNTFNDDKLHVRLAGIDAPEMGSLDKPETEQPFAQESKEYLKGLIQGEILKIKIVGVDQYDRVLAFAYLPYLPRWFLNPFFNRWFPIDLFGWFEMDFLYTNVNLEIVKNGYACVYTGQDAIYDKYKKTLRGLEKKAKREKKGMWILPNPVTPMEFKRIHRH